MFLISKKLPPRAGDVGGEVGAVDLVVRVLGLASENTKLLTENSKIMENTQQTQLMLKTSKHGQDEENLS